MAIPCGPAAVSLITAGGTDIPWRPNADPSAVLGITVVGPSTMPERDVERENEELAAARVTGSL